MEKKKQFIGKNVVWDSSLSAISFLLSVILATYEDFLGIPGIVLKTLFVILGLFFTGKSIVDIISSKKNNYTYEDLLSDINKLNEIAHNHSIVLIKDSFEIDGKKYRWMTITELEMDEEVQKKNRDILEFVKELV